MATNKDSFDQLIAKAKNGNNSQKISVRRNILNKENSNVSHNDRVTENDSTIKGQKTDFLPLNSTNYIEDSDSNTSCPLQTYSSENPINFLTIELASSSNDSTDQCAHNYDISNHPHKTSPDSLNSTIKMENIKIEKLSSEDILIHEEINNRSREFNVLENKMDIDTKKKVSEFTKMETENEEQAELSKKSRSGTKYNSNKCVVNSESRDRWQKKLYNEDTDPIIEDIEHFVEDSDNMDIQNNYGK